MLRCAWQSEIRNPGFKILNPQSSASTNMQPKLTSIHGGEEIATQEECQTAR